MATDSRYRLRTVQAACDLIEFFANSSKSELGVSEIADALHLSKAAVYRLLQNLGEYGYIQGNAETRKYRLGVKFLLLGQTVSERIDLVQDSDSVLNTLRDRTGETVHLNLITAQGPVCVAERQTSHQLRFFTRVGMVLPWHAGAAGKVLLAFMPEDFQEQFLSDGELASYTQNTITRADSLRVELAKIRANGYATSNAEVFVGAWAAAAPIRNANGSVPACVSVVAPRDRINGGEGEIIRLVTSAAQAISFRLGSASVASSTTILDDGVGSSRPWGNASAEPGVWEQGG
jgi:DNA-binding IclR family transcriptional regulator